MKTKVIEEKMMQVKIKLKKQEQGCTFKPRLNENIKKIPSNLIERNETFLKEKNLKIKTAQIIENYNYTFAPKVNAKEKFQKEFPEKTEENDDDDNKSKQNSVIKNPDVDVGERLYGYQQVYKKNKEARSDVQKEKENYSFKPELNKNTDEILRKRDLELAEIQRRIEEKERLKAQILSRNEEVQSLKDRGGENKNKVIAHSEDPDMNNYDSEQENNKNKVSIISLRDEYFYL